MPTVGKTTYGRTIGQKPPFVAYVVEGRDNNNPGMIRRLRFDYDGGAGPWLHCEWRMVEGGQGKRLMGYQVRTEMAEKGAKLLEEYYQEIGQMDHYAAFCKHDETASNGQPFPEEWLPPKVRELQKIKPVRAALKWEQPDLPPIEEWSAEKPAKRQRAS